MSMKIGCRKTYMKKRVRGILIRAAGLTVWLNRKKYIPEDNSAIIPVQSTASTTRDTKFSLNVSRCKAFCNSFDSISAKKKAIIPIKTSVYIQKQRSRRNAFRQTTVATKLVAKIILLTESLLSKKSSTAHRVSKHIGQCRSQKSSIVLAVEFTTSSMFMRESL